MMPEVLRDAVMQRLALTFLPSQQVKSLRPKRSSGNKISHFILAQFRENYTLSLSWHQTQRLHSAFPRAAQFHCFPQASSSFHVAKPKSCQLADTNEIQTRKINDCLSAQRAKDCHSFCSYEAVQSAQESRWKHGARAEEGVGGIASSSKSLQLGGLRR